MTETRGQPLDPPPGAAPTTSEAGPVLAGRFVLGAPLGSGGMATVYHAWDRTRGVACAVKILSDSLSRDEEFRTRFSREAEAVMSLAHERIVVVYGYGDDGPRQYIAMEYVPGGTVREMLARRGPLPEAEALQLAAEIADALAYAHGRGFVHRDVKPHNILLTADGHVKVADFGIARTLDGTKLTRTGSLVGSAHYVAPEQARGDPAGPAADQYALGVLLFELLAGRVPFDGEAPVAVALRHLHDPVPDLPAMRPGVSSVTVEIVRRLLAKSPEDRYPSAEAAAGALRRAAAVLASDGGATAVLPVSRDADASGGDASATARVATAPPSNETVQMPPPVEARPAHSASTDTAVRAEAAKDARRAATRRRVSTAAVWMRATVIVVAAAGAVALAATGYRGAWLAAHTTVPALTGRTVQDAAREVVPLNLGVIVTAQRQDAHLPVGVIVAQDPPAGSEVLKGVVLQLTVSQGSGIVPDLYGLPVSGAARLLEGAGLRLGAVSYTRDDQIAAGDVIHQFQSAGTHLEPNGAVDVLVSAGPPQSVPNTPSEVPASETGSNDNK
ncbi:MAG TPA: protein kinase [bacterium]|nr:protein kinase [bacterium]